MEELECKEVGNPIPVPPLEATRPIKWKQYPKKAVIDVNKYIAKYDFEIARKIKGGKVEVLPYTEKQRVFHRFAIAELLFEVSRVLNGGQKYFNGMSLLDGTKLDIQTSGVMAIPEDCKLVIVNYVPVESQEYRFKGLKGNTYDLKDDQSVHQLKTQKMRESINQVIDQWFTSNITFWNNITPSIQTNNKI